MDKFFLFVLIMFSFSCSDPNIIGLEVQPESDNILINNSSDLTWQTFNTKVTDSLATNSPLNFVLGEINDPIFGHNKGSFLTQLLLSENNIAMQLDSEVDSVILEFNYSGYYGVLEDFTDLDVKILTEDLFKDSTYYFNSFSITPSNTNWVENFSVSKDSENAVLKIRLSNDFGQQIIDLGEDKLIDNETFLGHFKGISVTASANNTILYLNPQGSKTSLSIYYHNSQDDSLALNLQLNNDATHVNVFNTKEDATIINDSSRIYIQSMAGYRANIMIKNLDSIKEILKGKAINKVTMRFDVEDDSQLEYLAHEKMFLVRVDQFGNNIFLTDYTIEGESHFGGRLDENKYVFNITRYFVQLLNNNSFTNELYLLPSGSVINANRTILNNDITLEVYYSQL